MMRNAAKKPNFQTNNLVNMKDKIQLTVQMMTFAPSENLSDLLLGGFLSRRVRNSSNLNPIISMKEHRW